MKRIFFIIPLFIITSVAHVLGQEWHFLQVADPQLGMVNFSEEKVRLTEMVEYANTQQVDFVIICGDLVHHANDSTFSQFRSIIEKLDVPYYLLPGNHDMGRVPDKKSINQYKEYFGSHYYTFVHKGYRFVLTNSMLWKNDLGFKTAKHNRWFFQNCKKAKQKGQPMIVAGHYPLFINSVSEDEHNFNLPVAKRNELLKAFERYNVVAYLSGHQHELKVNQHGNTQLVTGETLSNNFDDRPFGFRYWTVTSDSVCHQFIPVLR